MAFGVWDYVVFISTLIISAGIGVYTRFSGGRQKTSTEYLMADRSMSIMPVAFSLMATFISSITILGVSSEIYEFGTMFVGINVSYGVASPLIAYLYLPVFYKLQATSAYEYLERRFGKSTRLVASICYSLQMIMYMGIVLFAPALALEALTGLNKTWSILLIGVVCTFYATIGGMKAVLLTDVFQSILMYVAVLAVAISGIVFAGGVTDIFKVADAGNRLELWNFNPDPTIRLTWWSLVIGNTITYMSLYAVNQAQVQRLLTVRDLKSAQTAVWLSWPILSFLSLSCAFSGLVIYYYYRSCDPLLQGRISSRDQNMPLYVSDALGHIPGLSGIFVAGIFSGCMSSVSSTLNSLAAVTVEDYFKPLYFKIKKKPWNTTSATVSKLIACIFGAVCIAVAFLAQFLGGILQASLTLLFGTIGGPLLALFTLGMVTERANEWGATLGLLVGIGLSVWLGFSPKPPSDRQLEFSVEDCSEFGGLLGNQTEPEHDEGKTFMYLYRLSYMYAALIGFVITFGLGYGISIFLRLINKHGKERIFIDDTKTTINPDLFFPVKAKYIRRRNLKFEKVKNDYENEKY